MLMHVSWLGSWTSSKNTERWRRRAERSIAQGWRGRSRLSSPMLRRRRSNTPWRMTRARKCSLKRSVMPCLLSEILREAETSTWPLFQLTQSTRYADARNAYREVQERHEDIKRIAQTMTELQELFNDMAMLVERQDEQIQTIEASAMDVENNMGAAHTEIEKGKVSARKARKK